MHVGEVLHGKYNIEEIFLHSVYKVKLCDLCKQTKPRKFDKIRPELHPVNVQSPWHHFGIDLRAVANDRMG